MQITVCCPSGWTLSHALVVGSSHGNHMPLKSTTGKVCFFKQFFGEIRNMCVFLNPKKKYMYDGEIRSAAYVLLIMCAWAGLGETAGLRLDVCVNNLDPPANRSYPVEWKPSRMCFAYFKAPRGACMCVVCVRDARHLSGPMPGFIHQSDTAEWCAPLIASPLHPKSPQNHQSIIIIFFACPRQPHNFCINRTQLKITSAIIIYFFYRFDNFFSFLVSRKIFTKIFNSNRVRKKSTARRGKKEIVCLPSMANSCANLHFYVHRNTQSNINVQTARVKFIY